MNVLLLGLGNRLMRDAGVGEHAADALVQRGLPPGVEAATSGQRGFELTSFFDGRAAVLIVDGLAARGHPGETLRLTLDRWEGGERLLHAAHLPTLVEWASALGPVPRLVVWGIETASLDYGLELTADVKAGLSRALGSITEDLRTLSADAGI